MANLVGRIRAIRRRQGKNAHPQGHVAAVSLMPKIKRMSAEEFREFREHIRKFQHAAKKNKGFPVKPKIVVTRLGKAVEQQAKVRLMNKAEMQTRFEFSRTMAQIMDVMKTYEEITGNKGRKIFLDGQYHKESNLYGQLTRLDALNSPKINKTALTAAKHLLDIAKRQLLWKAREIP
jgi:hypothetical protein